MDEMSRWPRTLRQRIGVPLGCEGTVKLKVDRKIHDTTVKARGGIKDNFRQAGQASDKGTSSKVRKREPEGVKLG